METFVDTPFDDRGIYSIPARPRRKFKDLGGMGEVIKQLKEMIEWPLKYKNIFTKYCVLYKVGIGANLVSTAYCTL